MKEEDFYIGAIIGQKVRGSRWRAVVVLLKAKGLTRAGHVTLRDDEGVRPTEKVQIGLCIDPDAFELKNDIVLVTNPPEFEISDYAVVHDGDLIENVGSWKNPKSMFGFV